MQLYFIRHAQSENNALWVRTRSEDGRSPDPSLTDIGHQQAQLVGKHLANKKNGQTEPQTVAYRHTFNLTHLYTSMMLRAVITSDYIAKETGLTPTVWEMIHEWGGIFERQEDGKPHKGLPGANRSFFETNFPNLILPEQLGEDGWWNRPHESREKTLIRAKQFLHDLLERHGGTDARVGIVSHGGFGFTLLDAMIGFTSPNTQFANPMNVWFSMNNTSISRIDFESDYMNIVYLNRLDHLPSELIT
ncbi:MAG: histidine phosphatase family protein [Chloroflexi bacterium]|nr:histidine phosphatase family protein [Chloroflexota bacterium]